MTKIFNIVLSLILVAASFFYVYAEPNITLLAETAVLIDSTTGQVLYDKNKDKQMYPASTTKIMTAILALENCELDEVVTIDSETPFTEGSRVYLLEGEKLTVEQLLYALILESANDAAIALAKHISGTVEDFAELMNKKASEVGALNTHFTNPNGLPDENHLTTAYDLSMIARYAMQNEKFREIVGTVRYHIDATEKQDERFFKITNRLLWDNKKDILYNGEYVAPKYEYATGVKTGYTIAAGSCLVASAKKNGREVIAVTLKSDPNNLYLDSRVLLDHGLNDYKNITLAQKGDIVGTVDIKNGKSKTVSAIVDQDIIKTVSIDFNPLNVKKEIDLIKEIKAPIESDENLGTISIQHDEEILAKTYLVAQDGVEESITASITVSILGFLKSLKTLLYFALALIGSYMAYVVLSNLRRKRRRRIRREKYKLDSHYINRNILK